MRKEAKGEPTDAAGSQTPPLEDAPVGLPPGLGFAGDSEEEEPERLEDLESEEGGEEGPEEEPEPLTPREQALKDQLEAAQTLIGRQGDELGQLRQRGQPQPGQGITPVQGQPQEDPFEAALIEAGEQFLATGDIKTWVRKTNQIQNAKIAAAGQYFQQQIVGETRAESDFFAKHSDLLEGTPRSIYEGELAKAKLLNPRMPLPQQRMEAAEQTRNLLKDLKWTLVDEDEAARREADKLRGPGGRRSRTGAPAGPSSGSAVATSLTQQYVRDAQAATRRSQSRAS